MSEYYKHRRKHFQHHSQQINVIIVSDAIYLSTNGNVKNTIRTEYPVGWGSGGNTIPITAFAKNDAGDVLCRTYVNGVGKLGISYDRGKTWELVGTSPYLSNFDTVSLLEYVNGYWFVEDFLTNLYYSNDLINWNTVPLDWNAQPFFKSPQISYFNGEYFITMGGTVLSDYLSTTPFIIKSSDLINWNTCLLFSDFGIINSDVYINQLYFSKINGELRVYIYEQYSNIQKVAYTTNGIDWNLRDLTLNEPNYRILYANNSIFFGSSVGNTFQKSLDGINWEQDVAINIEGTVPYITPGKSGLLNNNHYIIVDDARGKLYTKDMNNFNSPWNIVNNIFGTYLITL